MELERTGQWEAAKRLDWKAKITSGRWQYGMALWWRVFNLNKITQRNLLLWQGITQHVATIIIEILKAGEGAEPPRERQRRRARRVFTSRENTYVCRKTCSLRHAASKSCLLYFSVVGLTFLTFVLTFHWSFVSQFFTLQFFSH